MHICSNLGETMVSVVHFLVTTVWKFCIAKPGLQGQAWALKISSQALDKGLSRAWPGLFRAGPGWAWAFRPSPSITTSTHKLQVHLPSCKYLRVPAGTHRYSQVLRGY